jgi:thiol-disulfide isomerase/thioredoxin
MHFIHADPKNNHVEDINKHVGDGKDVFILVYMEGCGPCEATRPQWAKIKGELEQQYKKKDNVVVVDIDKDLLPSLKHIGSIDGFPTIKYIGKKGSIVESYENSSIKNKNRTVDSFVQWIESKINHVVSVVPKSSPDKLLKRLTHKKSVHSTRKQKGGKRKSRKNRRKHKK